MQTNRFVNCKTKKETKKMKFFNKVKSVVTNAKNKIAIALTMASVTLMTSPVYAVTVNTGSATNKAKNIADILTYIFPLMGAFFALSGVIKWVMAFRSEQPEQQASAVKEIIIGVVCIVFRAFLWNPISSVIF